MNAKERSPSKIWLICIVREEIKIELTPINLISREYEYWQSRWISSGKRGKTYSIENNTIKLVKFVSKK